MSNEASSAGAIPFTTWNALPATIEVGQGDTVTASLIQKSGQKPVSGTYALIDQEKGETMLHEHETEGACDTCKWYTNSLPSNQPIEDRHDTHALSELELERLVQAAGGGPGEFWRTWHGVGKSTDARWIISSVVDGFGGPTVADTINRVLHASLAFALGCTDTTLSEDIIRILKTVYQDIDHAVITAPQGFIKPDPTSHSTLPPGATSWLSAAGLLHPLSGAMANTVLVDLVERQIYVANLGDSRAVAGLVDDTGTWSCKPMSEDQTIKNDKEVQALIARHPGEQASEVMTSDNLIKRMSAQTRHFGKAHLKAPRAGLTDYVCHPAFDSAFEAIGQPLTDSFLDQKLDGVPYILSTPDVWTLPFDGAEGRVRAIVLSTDGLWDRLTSEESMLLIAQYLSGQDSDREISKKDLPTQIQLRLSDDRPHPDDPLPGSKGRDKGSWTLVDENPATMLIRDAIGDGDPEVRRMVLSLGPPMGRAMRDDMTVTVLLFDGFQPRWS